MPNSLLNRLGISQDSGKAVGYFKMSSHQGNPMPQFCDGSRFVIRHNVKLHPFQSDQLLECSQSIRCRWILSRRESLVFAVNVTLTAQQFQLSLHKGDPDRTN
jgi:hypothetical protein